MVLLSLNFVGRIVNKRSAGSKLYFYDIRSGETMLQVMSSLSYYSPEGEDPETVQSIIFVESCRPKPNSRVRIRNYEQVMSLEYVDFQEEQI